MKISSIRYDYSPISQKWDSAKENHRFDMPDRCPNCHAYGSFLLAGCFRSPDDPDITSALFYCPHCHLFFMAYFECENSAGNSHQIKECFGVAKPLDQFSDLLYQMSPEFCETYKEAWEAERAHLMRAAGPAYRKALEFLVKDFAKCRNKEEDPDRIDKMPMMQAIKKFIAHSSIQTLSQAATWLGNDQTHTTKLHEDYDLKDLKLFNLAVAKYIDLELTTDQALDLLEQKQS